MSFEPFVTIQQHKYNNITIFYLIVEKDLPTPLQWRFAMEDIKFHLEERKKEKANFGFIMDVRKVGMVPIGYIQEFVKLLESYGPLLQDHLIATSMFAEEGSIIDVLFGLVKKFYKTKKPLKFVYNIEDAYTHINEYVNNIIRDDDFKKS
jgi:hypothetical protein